MNSADALVLTTDGRPRALGGFLDAMIKSSGLSVSAIARRAHLSRSFLYLLLDDRQVPSVESLVSVLEAAGAEGVRPSEPGRPGEIEFLWADERYWIRLPDTGQRSARSKNALRTLSSAASVAAEDPWAGAAAAAALPPPALAPLLGPPPALPPPPPAQVQPAAAVPAAPAPAAPGPGTVRRPDPQARTELLGELVRSAANLDEERLRLLIEHANLLRRGR